MFCFTGTGNSWMIAKKLASELKDSEIVRITQDCDFVVEDDTTRLGLIFPVYYGGLPALVRNFLPSLQPYKDCYFFAVTTHAGNPGRALAQLRAELQQVGLQLSSGFNLRMPQNYIMSYNVPDKVQVNSILARALDITPPIIDVIRSKRTRLPETNFPPYSGQSKRYQNFIAKVKDSDTRFWCDEGCIECEVCVRVCPVQNIVIVNGTPQWFHNCEQCLACLNWCPVRAIQYGEWTSEKGRYTNPQVTIDDW